MPYPILAPLDALSTMRAPFVNHASTVKSMMPVATEACPQIGESPRTKPLSTQGAAE
jgi:hypothetical protein